MKNFKFNTVLFFLILSTLLAISCNKETTTVEPPTVTNYELIIENGISIDMRDGIKLSANVYRPDAEGKFPVILSCGPYDKDDLPAEYDIEDDGDIQVSEHAAFERPDPGYWVKNGYVVIAVDSRGTGKSEGKTNIFESSEAEDHYDAIEWAGEQNWSNGNVGLNGVSIFGITQWNVAALNPPHLKAIMPYEGFTDLYRDATYHGGIASSFINGWFQYRILENLSPVNDGFRDLRAEVNAGNLSTASIYLDANITDNLSSVNVPAYVAVSIQDHGLHTRGTIRGFEEIASNNKWLELHGRKKWEYYYSEDALSRQKSFFDYFLKKETSDIMQQPAVRYELRTSHYNGEIKSANTWPIPNRQLDKLFLDAESMSMSNNNPSEEKEYTYDATVLDDPELITDEQRAIFRYTFQEETDIVGSMKLNLHVSSDMANDIDLFVGIQKEDSNGNIVYFEGPGESEGQVASGWLRASHRAEDSNESTEEIPFHRHDLVETFSPGEIVNVQVEIWPTTTKYSAGETLVLVIQGNDILESQEEHEGIINEGNTIIHTGGDKVSYLQIPTL